MRRICLVALLSLGAGSALAQGVPTDEKSRPAEKPQRIDFTGIEVTGTRVGPNTAFTTVPRRPGFKNLIKLRGNFHAELATSGSGL